MKTFHKILIVLLGVVLAGDAAASLPDKILSLLGQLQLTEGRNLVAAGGDTLVVTVVDGQPVKVQKELFCPEFKDTEDGALLDFAEEACAYALLGVTDSRFADITFQKGSWNDLRKVNADTPCSIQNASGRRLTIEWSVDGKPAVTMLIPVVGGQIAGGTRSEMEDRFILGIRKIVTAVRPEPDFVIDDLERLDENLFVLRGGYCLSESINRDAYLVPDADCVAGFVFSDAYPLASMANCVVVGCGKDAVTVRLTVLKHEYGETETFSVPLESIIQYAQREGCTPYWGVSSYEKGTVQGTLLLNNTAQGYNHVVRLEGKISQIGKTPCTLTGRASLYVPNNNVQNLFETHKQKTEDEKIKWR